MKTHFLKTLKQRLFLLIAVLGTFISYAQSTPIIGGSRTPDTGGLMDIGVKQVPPITPFTITTQSDIGGRGLLVIGGKSTDANEIGGRQDIPTMIYGYEIGGSVTSDNLGQISFSACLVTNSMSKFDFGGTSTTSVLHSTLALAIGGVKPPVGEFTKSEAISCKSTGGAIGGGKSQEPTLLPDGIKPILEVYS